MQKRTYNDGVFSESNDVLISARDTSLLMGHGAKQEVLVVNKKPILLDHVIKSFINSTEIEGVKPKESAEEIKKIIYEMIDSIHANNYCICLLSTGGEFENCVSGKTSFRSKLGNHRLIINSREDIHHLSFSELDGIKLHSHHVVRHNPAANHTSHSHALSMSDTYDSNQAFTGLGINASEHITCADFANFFAFSNGKFCTPKEGIYKGTARKIIIEICEKIAPIEERVIAYSEIKDFKGAFITSLQTGLLPVKQIDKIKINDGKVCPEILELRKMYQDYLINH